MAQRTTAPGPTARQMLPSLLSIRRDPITYLMRVWREYGDVVQFPVPSPPSYLVNDPDGVRRVLVGNARSYGKATLQYRSLSLITGEGLLVADTDEWRRQRPLVQPAFRHSMLDPLIGHVDAVATAVTERWSRTTAVVDVDETMMRAALEVVGDALLGTDLAADASRLTSATLDGLAVVIARARTPLAAPAWVPTPSNRRLARSRRELDAAVASIVAGRAENLGDDMVGVLLGARDEDGQPLSAEELRDQLVTFIVAGHETVASAMTWALGLLAAHPDVLDRLRTEADAVLGDEPPTFDRLRELVYARAVFDETLRLYPPAWLVTRNVLAADELGGREIPAGALVIISPWLLQRHPDRWPDPDAFDPSRFVDGRADRETFIAFGAGPRQCIGRDFAYVEGPLMLARIAQRCALAFPSGQGLPAADPQVTVRPCGGMPLVIGPRTAR